MAPLAPQAFRNVGAAALATLAERANAIFGPDGVPASRQARRSFLDQLSPEACRVFEQLDSDYQEFGVDLDDQVESYAVRIEAAPRHG